MCDDPTGISNVVEDVAFLPWTATKYAVKAGKGIFDAIGGDGPDYPDYPGLTADEQKLLAAQKMNVDQLNDIVSGDVAAVKANRQLLNGVTGLFDENGEVNQGALKDLQGRVQAQMKQRDALGQKGLDYMGSFFDTNAGPMEQEIVKAAQARYLRALKGDLPVSEGTKDQFATQFAQLKEAAAQRGIKIEGDDWNSATSSSTAGVRLISEFTKRYNLAVEGEREHALDQGPGTLGTLQNISLSNFNTASSVAQYPAALGFLEKSGSLGTSLIPQISAVNSGYGSILGTLRGEDMGAYNAKVREADMAFQQQQQLLQTIGYLGGTLGAAYLTGGASIPFTAMAGPKKTAYLPNDAYAGAAA